MKKIVKMIQVIFGMMWLTHAVLIAAIANVMIHGYGNKSIMILIFAFVTDSPSVLMDIQFIKNKICGTTEAKTLDDEIMNHPFGWYKSLLAS